MRAQDVVMLFVGAGVLALLVSGAVGVVRDFRAVFAGHDPQRGRSRCTTERGDR